MAEYTMGDIFEDVVIEIEGSKFKLRERTKARGEVIDKLQTELGELPDDADDAAAVALILDVIDAMLEPLGDGNNGTRTHAKTILKKQFEADQIGSDRIIGLQNWCMKKMQDRMDPFASSGPVNAS